ACNFPNLLHQDGRVGQLVKITNARIVDPAVNRLLCFFNGHAYSLFFVSIEMVTGPSFSKLIFMSAPKTPVCTSLPISADSLRTICSYSGMALSGRAAR